jgi:hypothetical protein
MSTATPNIFAEKIQGNLSINSVSSTSISAVTYYNLPVTADTFVTGFTFNASDYNLTIKQNNGQPDLTQSLSVLASDLTVTGGTYNSNTGVATFTNNTGGTFQVTGFLTGFTDTLVTAFTYNNNTFTITDSRSSAFTATIDTMTGLTATTISATTYQNLPSQSGTGVSAFSYSPTSGILTITKNDTNTLTAGTFTYITATTLSSLNVLSVTSNGGSPTTTTVNAVTGGSYSNGTITLSGTGNFSSSISGFPTTFTNDYLPLSGGTVTGATLFQSGLSANTISATTYQNLPSQSGTGISAFSYSQTTGVLTITKNDTNTLTAGTFSYITATTLSSLNVLSVNTNGGTPTTTTINALTGGSYSNGTITLSGTGTIQSAITGFTKYFTTGSTPTGVVINSGDRWYNTNNGIELVYINDGNSSQWVQPANTPGPPGYSNLMITSGITTSAVTLSINTNYYGVNYNGNVNLTLPNPSGYDGYNMTIKDEGGYSSTYRIRLTPLSGLIDGNAYVDMNLNYIALHLVARNNNWWLI